MDSSGRNIISDILMERNVNKLGYVCVCAECARNYFPALGSVLHMKPPHNCSYRRQTFSRSLMDAVAILLISVNVLLHSE